MTDFPSRGNTVTIHEIENRKSISGEPLSPVIEEVSVLVTEVYPEYSIVLGTELSRFCYVEGNRGGGKAFPPANPYGSPGVNSYLLDGIHGRLVNN